MSEQESTGQNRISGREVAECGSGSAKPGAPSKPASKYGKADLRYWKEVIFHPTYKKDGKLVECRDYSVRMMHKGRRGVFPLETQNEVTAAGKAKEIYEFLRVSGWDVAIAKYKEKGTYKMVATTVGDFIAAVIPNAKARTKTVNDYVRAFRTIVADICNIDGGKAKYDYYNGGNKLWLDKIHAVKLARITPEKVKQWQTAFLKRVGKNPAKETVAKISVNSLLRQAKSLFTPAMLGNLDLALPDGLPFDEVKFEARQSMKYKNRFDVAKIFKLAMEGDADEQVPPLPDKLKKVFLLAVLAGLRRNEIDKLEWSAFLWDKGVIRIENTKYLRLKSQDSEADVDVDAEFMAVFKTFKKQTKGDFVIESEVQPRLDTKYTHYRNGGDLRKLSTWLRGNGISSSKPLHALRKEFGSQINAKFGVYAASHALRHGDIAITAGHYLDVRKRVTMGFDDLLPNEKPAAEPESKVGKPKKPAAKAKQSEPAEESDLVPAPNGQRKPGFFRGRAAATPRKRGS